MGSPQLGSSGPRWRLLVAATMAVAAGAGADLAGDAVPYAGRPVTDVALVGLRYTRPYIVLRELRTRVGAPLSADTLAADIQRLDNLDLFSSIRASLAAGGDGGVGVTLLLRELPPVMPYISYDVTDQDGWSFGPAVKAVNLLGRDIFLAGYALFGGHTGYLVDLTHPWLAGDHLSFHLNASRVVRQNEFDGFEETSAEVTPRLGTWIGRRGRASVAASYLRFDADVPGHTLSPGTRDELVRLGASLGFDSRDSWSNPGEGWLDEAEVWKTGGVLPGDGDFWTANLDLRRFQPLPAGHTLVLATLLTLQTGQVGRDLPEYLQLRLGGANSLRGYRLDELGRQLFGADQLLTTAEYQVPLLAPREVTLLGLSADLGLGGALFLDGGLAWTGRQEFDLSRARLGGGFGLRLLVPAVDVTRLDIGFGADGGWRVHLAAYSKMRAQRLRLR